MEFYELLSFFLSDAVFPSRSRQGTNVQYVLQSCPDAPRVCRSHFVVFGSKKDYCQRVIMRYHLYHELSKGQTGSSGRKLRRLAPSTLKTKKGNGLLTRITSTTASKPAEFGARWFGQRLQEERKHLEGLTG